jgi:hypothetical protein
MTIQQNTLRNDKKQKGKVSSQVESKRLWEDAHLLTYVEVFAPQPSK